jgi:hypothetical protein
MTRTPGPWRVTFQYGADNDGNGYDWAVQGSQNPDSVLPTEYIQNPAYANNESNARLIAAAPGLLAIVEGFLATLDDDNPAVEKHYNANIALWNAAIEAHKQATGEEVTA